MSQVLSAIQYIFFRKTSGSNMGARNLLLAPWAPSNLGTSLVLCKHTPFKDVISASWFANRVGKLSFVLQIFVSDSVRGITRFWLKINFCYGLMWRKKWQRCYKGKEAIQGEPWKMIKSGSEASIKTQNRTFLTILHLQCIDNNVQDCK